MIKQLLFLISLISLALSQQSTKKVLILSDNTAVYVSHSQLFQTLRNQGYKLEFKNIQSATFNLQVYGEWQYDQLIIFATNSDDIRVQEKEILEFYDSGRNILLLGAPDQSRYFRKLMNSFGFDMLEYGALVQDYFNNYRGDFNIPTTNQVAIMKAALPIAYAGAGLQITPYETTQVYGFVRGSESALTNSILSHNIVFVGATQGRNNARFVVTGGWDIFGNQFLNDQKLGNAEVLNNIIKWNFKQSKVLKAENLIHKRLNSDDIKPYNYRVSEFVYFSIDILEWNGEAWQPYISDGDDVYLEFVMLDPYYRIPLRKGKNATYEIEFQIPDKYGVFQFKVNYLKPGYSFIKVAEKITVRPFRHDEHKRYLVQAIPYYLGSFGTMAGFLVFLIAFLLNK